MDEKSLLIGIPSMREDSKFFSSIYNLISSLKGKYRVSVLVEKWRDLAEAQNRMAEYFLQNDFDYLLFCDDDVYGHTSAMVDALVKAEAPVAAMQAYQRHYPYPNLLMFNGYVEKDSGYADIDLTGFQMLLVRREAFEYLKKPYFIAQFDGMNTWATDQLFFARLSMSGVKMKGCWDYCLDHAGVTKENVKELREQNAPSIIDRFMAFRNTNKEN